MPNWATSGKNLRPGVANYVSFMFCRTYVPARWRATVIFQAGKRARDELFGAFFWHSTPANNAEE